jgi:ribosomal protein S18 acetylase RimI-like enzyme
VDLQPTADRAARAWQEVMALAARHAVTGRALTGAHGTTLFVTGAPVADLNAVASSAVEPDVEEVGRLVAAQDWTGVPWSIVVRGTPGAELAALARRHGLDGGHEVDFQLIELAAPTEVPPPLPGAVLRTIDGSEAERYLELVAAGFGAPTAGFAPVMTAGLLDSPEVTTVVAEVRGEPVGTAMTIVVGRVAVLVNVATLPAARSRGVGRAVTVAALRHAAAAGARVACLHPSADGAALYASLDAVTAERWTFLRSRGVRARDLRGRPDVWHTAFS